jgi:hypothetical protein
MQNGFEVVTRFGILKDAAREFVTPQLATASDDLVPEPPFDLLKGYAARLDNLTRDDIGVDHGYSKFPQQLRRGGLAHADAARKSV